MNLPVECYERIAEHLDAADRARLSMTCKAARNGCLRQKSIKAWVRNNQPNEDRMESFSRWLIARLDYVEELELYINVFQWNFTWRYKGVHVAKKLKKVRLSHCEGMVVCIASLEEVLPSCPNLEYLYMYAHVLHLGTSFSRMSAPTLVIDCERVSGEPLCWTIPGLQKLSITGSVDFPPHFTGLFFSKLKFLECQSTLLVPVIGFFTHLETLILDSTHCYFDSYDTFVAQLQLECPLKSLKLKGGEWMALHWVPKTVETLELLFCKGGVGTVSLPELKSLTCLGSTLHPDFIDDVSRMKLEYFRYESYGLPVVKPKLNVTATVIEVPAHDLKNLKKRKVLTIEC